MENLHPVMLLTASHFSLPLAGMAPHPVLTDLAKMHFETMSFFLVVLLASALIISWLWNALRGSFPRLPRLSYLKALALVLLWGLLFTVVLSMITGARELMTPGAWEREHDSAIYHIKQPGAK